MKPQNTSHAVMAQRHEAADSLDDFPTPPWAARALMEHVLGAEAGRLKSCLEPACGRGHMATTLAEYFHSVEASDVADYGFGERVDFLRRPTSGQVDWVITNPPFKLAEDFFHQARTTARNGVALLVRTVFLESVGRLKSLFEPHPPTFVAQFAERVPMVRARLDPQASTATGYAWFVWRNGPRSPTQLVWIPPCRRSLEKPLDYDPGFPRRG